MTGSASPLAAICGYRLPPKTGISSTRLVFGSPKRDRDRLRSAAGRTGDPGGFPSDLIQRMAGGRLKRLLSAPGGPTHNRRNPRRSAAAACIAAIDVLLEEPQIIDRLWDNTRFFKAGLTKLGFNTGVSESPITPVIVGDGALAMKLSDRLFQAGVFAQGIAAPTVPAGKARVRTIVTATHTRDELQFALDAFAAVGRELGIVP